MFFPRFGCWGGLPRGLGHNLLVQFSSLSNAKMEITSQGLLDQSQAGVYRGKRHIPPLFGPFWAYSCTLPQGVETHPPMSSWPDPPRPPLLETHFLEVLREVGGGQKSKPPFFGSKIMNLWFFSILSRKPVSGCRLHGVCTGQSGTSANAVCALFSHFCYVGGFGDLGDPVVPTPRGASGEIVTVYAY